MTREQRDEINRRTYGGPPGPDVTKLSLIRDALAAGDEITAVRIAAKFPRLGEEKAVIERGWMAHTRPEFVRELGRDPAADFAAAVAAIKSKYGL